MVTLLDVRSEEEFQSLPSPLGAQCPFEEMEKRLWQLPKEQEIVAYRNGPYSVL